MKNDLKKVFLDELSDLLSAENQILKGLPELIKASDSPELRDAFQTHFEQTKGHVKRLEQIFKMMNEQPKEEKCKAMEGMIKECQDAIKNYPKSPVRDAAIISKAQRIEHYEIAGYGTVREFAKMLDLDKAKSLLKQTEDEEGNADKILTEIAEGTLLASGVNSKAIA